MPFPLIPLLLAGARVGASAAARGAASGAARGAAGGAARAEAGAATRGGTGMLGGQQFGQALARQAVFQTMRPQQPPPAASPPVMQPQPSPAGPSMGAAMNPANPYAHRTY